MRALTPRTPGGQQEAQQGGVDQLELLFYEAQLELYDTKFEILKNEEQLLMAQVDTLRRQIRGNASARSWGSSRLHQVL